MDITYGHTEPYRAANGHTMMAPIDVHSRVQWWRAWCVDGCLACADGDIRPDW